MITKIVKYFALFYSMYFLGHFLMTMAYRFGDLSAVIAGTVLGAAIIFTGFRASGGTGGARQAFYGIFCGVFLWAFTGEFLEHQNILAIAAPAALPALIAYVCAVLLVVYKKQLPVGIRFALGHFGFIWLMHYILLYEVEELKIHNQGLYDVALPFTGVLFLTAFMYLLYRIFRTKSALAHIAYALFAFICGWSTVEVLQAEHIVPDYTYFSYWAQKLLPFEQDAQVATAEKIDGLINSYEWEKPETKKLAAYLLRSRMLFPADIEDIGKRIDEKMQSERAALVNEELFCQAYKETFLYGKVVNHMGKKLLQYVREYRENHTAAGFSGRLPENIQAVIDKYTWDNDQTKGLAAYILSKITESIAGDFDIKLQETTSAVPGQKVTETMFCNAFLQYNLAVFNAAFSNEIDKQIRQYKKQGEVTKNTSS